jgi:hypothetical protein
LLNFRKNPTGGVSIEMAEPIVPKYKAVKNTKLSMSIVSRYVELSGSAFCRKTYNLSEYGVYLMLIFRSLKNKIEDEIIGKIIHLTTFTLRDKI